jgi:hypothetical protein
MAKQIVWPKEAINDENTREIFIGDYRLLYKDRRQTD